MLYLIRIIWIIYRSMVACRFSFNDGDRRAIDIDVAVCVQRIRMGTWILLPYNHGCCYLLCLLSNVQSSWTLRKFRSPPYPFPGTCRRRLRWLLCNAMQPLLALNEYRTQARLTRRFFTSINKFSILYFLFVLLSNK